MESYSRIRSVKLKRPTPEHPFGLSVRGGHEHGTGIFVSSVTPRSIAHRQGLKIGDQILRVNGYPVSSAVHHECFSLMKVRTSLHLKVRSVGMIPVRERNGDPLTWKLIEEVPDPREMTPPSNTSSHHHHVPLVSRMSDTSSQPDSRIEFHGQEAKVYINTSGQSGLGCCICKGPPERPGIFVQSTKSNGVAREAGLRPGDQILYCNGHSFLNIPFAEAVYHLKSSKHLSLSVIKGAASDLFPGESSGYNSSASSLNGETHVSVSSEHSGPSEIIVEQHEVPKRLSMVTEEQVNAMEERGLIRRKNNAMALDRNMEWDEVEQVWHSAEKESIIIEVKGEDSNAKARIRSEEARLSEERKKIEEEQARLAEEASRLEEEKRKFEEEKRRTMSMSLSGSLTSRSSSSSESANCLAGALTQEILKRNERREQQESQLDDDKEHGIGKTMDPKKAIFTAPIDDEKRQQHEQLIEEFKRAHRKMFSQTDGSNLDMSKAVLHQNEERESFRAKRIQKEVEHARKMVEQRVAGIVRQRQLRIERQHQECQETEREVHKRVSTHNKPPPPPPPLPKEPLGDTSQGNVIHPEIPESSASTKINGHGQAKEARTTRVSTKVLIENKGHERPVSPSPDYSNSPSPTPETERKLDQDKVVHVTAYPSIYSRPEPSRLDFLHDPKSKVVNGHDDAIRKRDLENALARCHVTRPNANEEIKTNGNGHVTIILNGTRMTPNSGGGKGHGGILKNSSSNSSNSSSNGHDGGGNLKTISFGKF